MIRFSANLSTKFIFLVNSFQALQQSFIAGTKQTPCLLCDESTMNSAKICTPCSEDLPWNPYNCKYCAHPAPIETSNFVCGGCIKAKPPFSKTISPFIYAFPINRLVQEVKYHRKQYWLTSLCDYLAQYIDQAYSMADMPDYLVPIPMHKKKKRLRTYNHAELISYELSKKLRIPVQKHILKKVKLTESQVSLNKVDRLKNLRGSVILNLALPAKKLEETLKNKHIAVIDDVMTTKATSELVSKLLLDAGASRVDIWCLARTPKYRD